MTVYTFIEIRCVYSLVIIYKSSAEDDIFVNTLGLLTAYLKFQSGATCK